MHVPNHWLPSKRRDKEGRGGGDCPSLARGGGVFLAGVEQSEKCLGITELKNKCQVWETTTCKYEARQTGWIKGSVPPPGAVLLEPKAAPSVIIWVQLAVWEQPARGT